MGFLDWFKSLLGVRLEESPTAVPRTSTRPPPASPRQGTPRKLDLDASQFTPLADSEVKKQARALGGPWGNPWFGRRDLIPPADDPRTLLIDRALVGHGYLTPEELTEIHEVGAQMDLVRPDLALASRAADEAVARDNSEKEAAKQRKRKEAQERKEQHARDVATRRQTDIAFLGRGVSKGLADRRANVEKLGLSGLPVLASPSDVAIALEVSIPRLRWLSFHSEAAGRVHYVRFSVPKKNGGTRELAAPHRDLARCQRWILRNLLDKVQAKPQAHGFVIGRSTLTNASAHVKRSVVVNLDLVDFFPTITFPRVRGVFEQLGYSPAASTVLALLCTEAPRQKVDYAGTPYHVATGPRVLPQGAATSPALSNLVARNLDARLSGIATKLGFTYTRYADDLTFSGDEDASKRLGHLLARVRHIAVDEGFRVNEDKTRVRRRNKAQMVTGIVVNERPGVPRSEVRRLRAILHQAGRQGLAAQNRENHPHFESWIRGMIAYVSMVNPAQGRALRASLDALGPASTDGRERS